MPTCSIKQCRARTATHPGLTLHRLPSNKAMKKKWLEIIGAENLKAKVKMHHVCSLHFDESSINRTLQVSRLKEGAVPSPALLPKSTPSSKKSNSKNTVSQKTSCENENEARSPSPMGSDMSEDSSSEDIQTEEAINPSGMGKSCTTFAEAWSPIRDLPAPTTIDRVTDVDSPTPKATDPAKSMDSPALKTIGPPTNKTKSQQFLQTITIHRQNNKIKTLTKKCRIYQTKLKCLYEKIRRRDGRIAQLSYVIERLKENICFNNEGAIILEETEDPEDLAKANTQLSKLKDCTVSISNKVRVTQSTAGRRPLSSRTITPELPHSNSKQTKRVPSLDTSNPPPSPHNRTKTTTSDPLPSAPSRVKPLLRLDTTSDPLPSASKQSRPISSRVTTSDSPLSASRQTSPSSSSATTPDPPVSRQALPISFLALNTSKSHKGTNVSKETTSKDLMLVISPLTINRKKETKSKQIKHKLPPQINRRISKLHKSKDEVKNTTTEDLKLKVPPSPSPNRKMLEIEESTDAIENNKSKDSKHNVPRPPNSKTLKLYDSTELKRGNTTKDLQLSISPQSNRKIINLRDSTDQKDTTKNLKDTITPSSKIKKFKPNKSRDVIETSIETTLTTLNNEEALTPQECTDLLQEITLKDITKSSVTDKNAFIYIIEVD